MIIRCPSCTTRYDLPTARFDADGTMMKCSFCGHDWIESRAIEIVREPVNRLPPIVEPAVTADEEVLRLLAASQEAQQTFASQRKRRRIASIAWASLVFAIASPVALAVAFPEAVVKTAPASFPFYEAIGRDVNIYGLGIVDVHVQHLLVDGKRVVAVKGTIVNISSSVRKIPWLRFALTDDEKSELYSWHLETNARPLAVGESTNFVTRIASPPDKAGAVKIRFAQTEEIVSNSGHE